MKKSTMENIVPILIRMKNVLEKNRSPIQKYVMLYLIDLLKDYKNELNGKRKKQTNMNE